MRKTSLLLIFSLACANGGKALSSFDTTDFVERFESYIERPEALDCETEGAEVFAEIEEKDAANLRSASTFLAFEKNNLVLTLQREDRTLLQLARDALAFGRVDALEDWRSYDPWWMYEASGGGEMAVPQGLRFLEPESAEILEAEDTHLNILFIYPEGLNVLVQVTTDGADRFKVVVLPQDSGPALAFFRLRLRGDKAEGLYGLGAFHDHVNHRGKIRAMQMEVDFQSESANNEGHVRIPLLIGTSGWGVFVDSLYGMIFDGTKEDYVEFTVGSGKASRDGIVFYLFTALHPLDLTKHYFDVTGKPRLPAPWALGPWIWRDEGVDQAKVIADLEAIRDLDLATTGYWIDRPYASAVNSFDFYPPDYPDPASMVAHAHALGFKMALWHTPYVDPNDPDSRPLYDYAKEKGYFPPVVGVPFKWGPLVDFTNPEAYGWWQGLLDNYRAVGIEGYKLDYAEEVVLGVFGMRTKWLFADGSDDLTMHHLYQWWYHKIYAEMLPDDGGFLLCRTATIGDQVHAPIIWPGDLDAAFWPAGYEVLKDGSPRKAVGGFPASVIYGLGLGPSGFPFYGADTGGYIHAPPDKELFTRWFQQTALSSVMQVGNGASTVPWELGGPDGYDEEMLEWYRDYARLHLRLWPYAWTYAMLVPETGRPIQRPFGLQYPELGEHPWDTYFFGDDLLVAPVFERGQREREVHFPPGKWVDFFEGKIFEGPGTYVVPAPLWKLPLFIREGALLPMLRPTIDTLVSTTDPDRVDSYATTPGLLYVRVVPGPQSAFTVFDGTSLMQKWEENTLLLGIEPGSDFAQGAVFEIHTSLGPPTEVSSAGTTFLAGCEDIPGWCYRPDVVPSLTITVPAGSHSIVVKW